MAQSDNQDLIRVFENGSDEDKYEYEFDIRTEPATVIITVRPPQCQSVNDSDISSCNNGVANSAATDGQSQPKRRKIDTVSNSGTAISDSEQIFHVMREEENVCTRGIDQVEGRDGQQLLFSLSKSRPLQEIEANSCNENEKAKSQYTEDWTQDLDEFPVVPDFTGECSIHVDREEGYSVFTCFRLFFTDWLMNHLHKQTNKYADDLRAINIDDLDKEGHNMLKEWKTVSLTEMKGFILVLIHMGAVKKKNIEDYWCQDTFIASPFASQVLSRSRFRSIYNMLHMNDNHTYIPASQRDHDPLHKIRPVYNHLQERFQEVYTPNKILAIYEALSVDSSSSSIDQQQNSKGYIASSSNLSTLKLYTLSDCATGYVYRFELSGLKSKNTNICRNEPSEIGLHLMKPLLHKGYHLYTAESFTSPVLYKTLADNNTMCTGIVGGHRDWMPEDLVDEDLVMTGQIAFRRKNELCAVKWNPCEGKRNEGNLFILTSAHHPLETTSKRENNKNSSSVSAASRGKPVCVNEFNKSMLAMADHINQTLEFVPLTQQSMKWPKRVFLHLLTHCIKQAMIVYNKFQSDKGGKTMSLSLFVKTLGKELSDEFIAERGQPTPSLYIASLTDKPNPLIRTDHSHFHHLVHIPMYAAVTKRPRRRCRVCVDVISRIHDSSLRNNQQIRNRYKRTVSFWCAVCKVSLCMDPCFHLYHNEGDYISVGMEMDYYRTKAAESFDNLITSTSCQVDFDDD